jgi:hypothetical protein
MSKCQACFTIEKYGPLGCQLEAPCSTAWHWRERGRVDRPVTPDLAPRSGLGLEGDGLVV